MSQVHLRLSDALAETLRAYCKRHGLSHSKVMADALFRYLQVPFTSAKEVVTAVPTEIVPQPPPPPAPAAPPAFSTPKALLPEPDEAGELLETSYEGGEGPLFDLSEVSRKLGITAGQAEAEIDAEDVLHSGGDRPLVNQTGLITALGVAKRQGRTVTRFEAMLRSMGIWP